MASGNRNGRGASEADERGIDMSGKPTVQTSTGLVLTIGGMVLAMLGIMAGISTCVPERNTYRAPPMPPLPAASTGAAVTGTGTGAAKTPPVAATPVVKHPKTPTGGGMTGGTTGVVCDP